MIYVINLIKFIYPITNAMHTYVLMTKPMLKKGETKNSKNSATYKMERVKKEENNNGPNAQPMGKSMASMCVQIKKEISTVCASADQMKMGIRIFESALFLELLVNWVRWYQFMLHLPLGKVIYKAFNRSCTLIKPINSFGQVTIRWTNLFVYIWYFNFEK